MLSKLNALLLACGLVASDQQCCSIKLNKNICITYSKGIISRKFSVCVYIHMCILSDDRK